MRMWLLPFAGAAAAIALCSEPGVAVAEEDAPARRSHVGRAAAVIAAERLRLQIFHDGDRARYSQLVTDDLVMTHGNGEVFDKARELSLLRPPTPERPLPALSIEEPDVRIYGDVAVMVGKLVETASDGRRELVLRFTNAYRLRRGRWKLAAGQLTTLSRERARVDVPQGTLESYVGRYRNPAGRILEISAAGSSLFVSVGGEKLELVPVSATQFVLKDADVLLAFIKDRAGRTIGLINRRPNGDVVEETKVD